MITGQKMEDILLVLVVRSDWRPRGSFLVKNMI
jgi:hypothetical protein